MSWYLKGEVGKTLDATLRELSTLNIDSMRLKFGSLENDSLVWSASTIDATGAGTIVPDIGQVVELWLDGVRKFRGHVLAPRVGSRRISIEVVGPWWWMTRIPLTSDRVDSTGATAERANYVFATGPHKTKLETLISRAIVNGVPMRLGTVDTVFDTPNMSLAEMNCGQALAELMAWVPDAVAWFNYSDVTGNALPILNIGRRGNFTATTYTIGTDAVIDQDITPRLDLEVSYAKLDYVIRNPTTGKPAWATQFSGSLVAGKKQIITVSGPEISELLPIDDFDVTQIRTILLNHPIQVALLADQTLKQALFNNTPPPSSVFYISASVNFPAQTPKLTIPANQYFVAEGVVRDWMIKDLGLVQSTLKLKGWGLSSYNGGVGYGSAITAMVAQGRAVQYASGSINEYALFMDCEIPVISIPYPTLTTVYRKWAYSFIVPPVGLAAGLQAAQNWVPWEGPITLVADEVTGDNLLPRKYNLANALPACASMATLARSVSHDILSGRTTIDLGAPARADFGTLTSRIRRQPRDNIVTL